MKTRVLIVAFAAVGGWALGWFAGDARPVAGMKKGASQSGEADGGAFHGSSDRREVSLGNALLELRISRPDLASFVRFGAALEQLDSAQIARLLERVERVSQPFRDGRLAWLFARWMKHDPAAAEAWIRPRLDALAQDGPNGGFDYESNARVKLALAWAKADPEAAFAYAKQRGRSGIAAALLREAMKAQGKEDFQERIAMVRVTLSGVARDKMLRELHRDWAQKDPAAAFASAQALDPGLQRDKAIGETLTAWASKDAATAFAQYRALGLKDPVLLSKVLEKNAEKDPQQTLEWLQQLDATQAARCIPRVVMAWAKHDPMAALDWAVANGVSLSGRWESTMSIEHAGLGRSTSSWGMPINPLGTALKEKPEETLAWLRGLPSGEMHDHAMETAIRSSDNAKQALSLFVTLPPEAAARTASRIATLLHSDLEAAREWAASLPAGAARAQAWETIGQMTEKTFDLPPGPDRDAWLSGGLNRGGAVHAPAERLASLLEIGNPVLRRDMVDQFMEGYVDAIWWSSSNTSDSRWSEQEAAARAVLEQANIPEEWKQRWRTAPQGAN
jgi:hypothetical protein